MRISLYRYNHDSNGAKKMLAAFAALKQRAEKDKRKVEVFFLLNSRDLLAEFFYKANQPIINELPSDSEYFVSYFVLHKTLLFGSLHSKLVLIDEHTALVRSGNAIHDNDENMHQFEIATEVVQKYLLAHMVHHYNTWFAACLKKILLIHLSAPLRKKNLRI